MTVTAPSPRFAAFAGDGGSGPFPLPFRFLDAADVQAVVVAADGGREVLAGLVLEGAGDPEGGQATTPRAIAAGETLILWTDTALTQPADYIAADAFPAETHEAALDRLTLIAQDQRRDLGRALSAPPGDTLGPLPDAARRKGMLLTFDPETGDPVTDRDYAGFVAEVALTADLPASAFLAVVAEGAEQAALVAAEGAEQVAAVMAAVGSAATDIAAEGEAQVSDIEAAGEANTASYFATDVAGLTAAATDGFFGVVQTYGKGIDWKIDNAGAALFKGYGAGPFGSDIRAIRQSQLSSKLCTQFPPGWEVWWALDAELVDRAYIPYRTPQEHLGPYRRPLNTFGLGDLRDESPTTPVITPYAINGPLGALTAASVAFTSTATVLGITNTETHKPPNGTSITIRISATTLSGAGTRNYRVGQAGTVDINYKVIALPDISGEDFTDPTNADIIFTFTLTFDSSKQLGVWPDTNGDATTVHIGSLEVVRADSSFPLLADQTWGGYVSRGSASIGGIVLDSEGCFANAGLSDPGLIDFPPSWPSNIDYASGKTEVVLAECVGGAGASAYAVLSSEDYNADLSPVTNSNTFGLLFNNTTEEGQYAPYPSYNLSRHGANGIGLGLQAWWNRYGPSHHDYGVGGAKLHDLTPTFVAWSGRAERLGTYNSTKDITQTLQTNRMRIAAKARKRGVATNAELFQVLRAMHDQAAIAGMTPGNLADWIGLIDDSNGTRGAGEWTFRITAGGYMGVGQANVVLRNESIGGKGLYSGVASSFTINTTDGFVYMLERLKPSIAFALEMGLPAAVMMRGFTNDYQQVALDSARVIGEYEQYLWDPIRAEGADLILVNPFPSSVRFPGDTLRTPLIAGQSAYAAANERSYRIAPTTNAWSLAAMASYYQGDMVHLDTATGDVDVASQIKNGIINWRASR